MLKSKLFPIAVLLLAAASAQVAKDESVLQPPAEFNHNLYPPYADAKSDIKAAINQAAKENKRVIVEFGAIWCLDCHILDHAFHDPKIQPLLESNFIVVHVDIGRQQPPKNSELAEKYHIPLEKGIPALAVLDGKGKLLYSQKKGEFESARTMTAQQVIEFLNEWKQKKS